MHIFLHKINSSFPAFAVWFVICGNYQTTVTALSTWVDFCKNKSIKTDKYFWEAFRWRGPTLAFQCLFNSSASLSRLKSFQPAFVLLHHSTMNKITKTLLYWAKWIICLCFQFIVYKVTRYKMIKKSWGVGHPCSGGTSLPPLVSMASKAGKIFAKGLSKGLWQSLPLDKCHDKPNARQKSSPPNDNQANSQPRGSRNTIQKAKEQNSRGTSPKPTRSPPTED